MFSCVVFGTVSLHWLFCVICQNNQVLFSFWIFLSLIHFNDRHFENLHWISRNISISKITYNKLYEWICSFKFIKYCDLSIKCWKWMCCFIPFFLLFFQERLVLFTSIWYHCQFLMYLYNLHNTWES